MHDFRDGGGLILAAKIIVDDSPRSELVLCQNLVHYLFRLGRCALRLLSMRFPSNPVPNLASRRA